MSEPLLEAEERARIRPRSSDTAVTHSDVFSRRPLKDAGVDYSAGEVENLRSTRPEAGGALDRDLGDTFRSQRRTPGIWDYLHAKESERQTDEVFGLMQSSEYKNVEKLRDRELPEKYGSAGLFDTNFGATPIEQVRIAQEAQDRIEVNREPPKLDVPASVYRTKEQNAWLKAKLAARGQQIEQVEDRGQEMFERHAGEVRHEQRLAQEKADEAAYQDANRGVPAGFSASRAAPAVPALKGARSQRIREAADIGDGSEPSKSALKSARKGLLAGMSKEDQSAWRRMENQQKLPRRVGFGQESSLRFDWRDKPEQVAADLTSDDARRAEPRSMLDKILQVPTPTKEQSRSLAKPFPYERDRATAKLRAKQLDVRADARGPEMRGDLQNYVDSLNMREQRDSAYVNDFVPGRGVDFGHSNRNGSGADSDYLRAEIKAAQGGDGADEAREEMAIINSSLPGTETKERQARALGYQDSHRGMLSYDIGGNQYVGKERRAAALASGEGRTQGDIVDRGNAKPGIFSRMFNSFARWIPGLGRLFGQSHDTRFSAAPGQEAQRLLAKKAETKKRGNQRASPFFSMARMFGATPRNRLQGAADRQSLPTVALQEQSALMPGPRPDFDLQPNGQVEGQREENRSSTQPVLPGLDAMNGGGSLDQFGGNSQEALSGGDEYGLRHDLVDDDPMPQQDDPRFNVDDGGGGMNYVSPYQQALDEWQERRARR